MNILQQEQVSLETMDLLAKKAVFQDEFNQLTTQIRERHVALAELDRREKDFELAFQEEWAQKVKNQKNTYHDTEEAYRVLVENKRGLARELEDLSAVVENERILLGRVQSEKELMQSQLDDVKKEYETARSNNAMELSLLSSAKNEVETLTNEASAFKETYALKMQEIYGKEADLARKEHDLMIMENRLKREDAIAAIEPVNE